MPSKTVFQLSSAALAIAALGAGSTAVRAQDAAASAAVGDIVVTATRRAEASNRVPIALKAFGEEELGQLGVANFEELVQYLPSVRTASRGPAVSSIYIRGLSTDTAGAQILGVAGVQPNVAIYLNDAPAATPGRNLDIYPTDLARVEVLAGPQGTIFGASAMGGAIRYITNKPDLGAFDAGFSANAAATDGGDPSYGAEGFVNIPIIADKLAVRFVAYSNQQGGYIDNVAATYRMPWNPGGPGVLPSGNPLLVEHAIQSCVGVTNCVATEAGTTGGFQVPLRQSISNNAFVENNINDASYAGGRATIGLEISPDWSLEVMSMHQLLETDGVFDYAPEIGDLQVAQFGPNSLRDTISLSTLTLEGRLAFLDLIYTASYQDHHAVQQADYARYANIGLYMPFYNCDRGVYYSGTATSAAQGQTCYSPSNNYRVNNRNRRWTQELRLTTPADSRLRATAGLFYDINRIYDLTQWNYVLRAAGFNYDLPPHPSVNILGAGPLPGAGFVNSILRRDRQFAAFAESSFDIIPDRLTLTGGLRYYDEKASMEGGSSSSFSGTVRDVCSSVSTDAATGLTTCNYTPNPVTPTSLTPSSVLTTRLEGINPTSYSGVILKGNLNYQITDSSIIYATYSEGFRPGGFNRKGCNNPGGSGGLSAAQCAANRAYAPDSVTNYELGAKLGLFDRRLQVNLSAYVIDWRDIQIATFDQNISNQTFVSNLANARIKGAEAEVTARPTRELTMWGGFSYNDSELTSYTDGLRILGERVLVPLGSPLALSPEFQGYLRARYEWELPSGLTPFVQAGYTHVGSTISSVIDNSNILYTGGRSPYTTSGQTAVINGVTVRPGDVLQAQPQSFRQGAYDTLEASLGLSMGQWSLSVFVDNITDARPQLFTSANDGQLRITTSRPRTAGVRFAFDL